MDCVISDRKVAAVAGANINTTNHWKSPCQQAEIFNFELVTKDGYSESQCSCMTCDVIPNAPFVARTVLVGEILDAYNVVSHNPQVLFTDWFLRVKEKGFTVRMCPDILYITNESR